MKMLRYWVNLNTLAVRYNDLEYGYAVVDAEKWIGKPLGWFESPERLHRFIADIMLPVLAEAWKANPLLRLGQLISNAAEIDPYHVSDGDMREALKTLCE